MSHYGVGSSITVKSKKKVKPLSDEQLTRTLFEWNDFYVRHTANEDGVPISIFEFDDAIAQVECYPILYNLKLAIFRQAINHQDLSLVKKCRAEWGVAPSDLFKHGDSPVLCHLFGAHVKQKLTIEWIEAACDDESLFQCTSDNENALFLAVKYWAPVECVGYLLERYPDLYLGRSITGELPLHIASGENLALLCLDLRASLYINDSLADSFLIYRLINRMDFIIHNVEILRSCLQDLQIVLAVPGLNLDIKCNDVSPYELLKESMSWRFRCRPDREANVIEQKLMADFNKILVQLEAHAPRSRASMISVSTAISSTTVAIEELSAAATTPTEAQKTRSSKKSLSVSLLFGGRIVRARSGSIKSLDNSDDGVLPTSRSD